MHLHVFSKFWSQGTERGERPEGKDRDNKRGVPHA
jgi:hypothetical protein